MLRFGVVLVVGRGTAVLDGVNVVQPEEDVLGVFVLHFHNGKCHSVADGNMFPICMRKIDNIYVRQTMRGLFGDLFSFNIKLVVYETLAKT